MDLPNPGIEPGSPALQADSLPTELSGKPRLVRSGCHIDNNIDNIDILIAILIL